MSLLLVEDDENLELVELDGARTVDEWTFPELPVKKEFGEPVIILKHVHKGVPFVQPHPRDLFLSIH